MNAMQVFQNSEFGELGVLEIDSKPYFPATVCAKILGYANPWKAINDHCKKDGLTKREVIDSMGRKQVAKFIHEGNLYRLITHSKLPAAERFEKWVFDEVLPSIRTPKQILLVKNINEQRNDHRHHYARHEAFCQVLF